MTIDTARLRELASDPNVPKGQWFWLGNHSLVANHGKRPVVVSGRDLRLRDALSTYVADIRKRRSESWYVWPAFVDQEDDL